MPKIIDVRLVGISGDFDSAVPASGMAIEGRLFGTIFEEVPPEEKDIFTFPNGSITVRHFQRTPIDNNCRVQPEKSRTRSPWHLRHVSAVRR